MSIDATPVNPANAGKKVLFLNANETMRPYRVAPLGLAFVASATEAAGHEVRFVDFPESKSQLRGYRQTIVDWAPDYLGVGIRNLDNSDFHAFESYLCEPSRLVREARLAKPGIRVLLGGPAATVDPQLVMQRVQPDHVVLGEGEDSLPQVIRRLESGERLPEVIGACDSTDTPFRVTDVTRLPAPRLYQWVDNLRPYLRGDAGYPLQTKRGCPLKCSYCTYGRIEGTRYRFLDANSIADEVEGAMARGIRDFEFVDSTFNLPPHHAMKVLGALKERGLTANYVGTGLNPSKLPNELLATMREIGFRSVILTAESASDTMLASYQKNYKRSRLFEAADLLERNDIIGLWVFLIGGPCETAETVEETLSFIEERIHPPQAVYITSGIRVYPGSPIADDANSGLFAKEDLRRRSDLPGLDFFYSNGTPPDWLEARLRRFQAQHPHVMLSCEGHSALTQVALRIMNLLPFRKPYWQYIPALNRVRRMAW
ncbi:MAG TPA: radical SAM protein [Chthoniobacteraceae bacterium]|nr:radical SAM protein [Chthoniobacteraceae bacterium]